MHTVREPILPEKRPSETAVQPVEPASTFEPQPELKSRWVRFATPVALILLAFIALAITYLAVVVPARLAFLLVIWIGSMGLFIFLPFLTIVAVTKMQDGRRSRPVIASDEELESVGRRVA